VTIGPDTPLPELEALYRDTPLGPIPEGIYDGELLRWLTPEGPCVRMYLAIEWVGFVLLPWGIRFDRDLWWFVCPPLNAGRFTATGGPSRWRDTETYRLDYGSSCLPRCFRDRLYDEVKPLDENTCLGIGGINRDRGQGDNFFFKLTRRS
jgi:hypothetical protein